MATSKKKQEKVTNILGDFLSSMANQTGEAGVSNPTEQDLSYHSSLINILKANENNLNNFSFQPLTRNSVRMTFEELNVRKAPGYDSISPKIL